MRLGGVNMNISSLISKDFLVIDSSESVSSLLGKLRTYEKRSALVFHNKKYQGLVLKKRLLSSGLHPETLKLDNIIQNTPILSEDTDIIEASRLLSEADSDVLPVQKGKEIIGVVSGLQLAQAALKLPDVAGWKVKDIKTIKSLVLQKGDPVAVALHLMHDHGVDQIPILDKSILYGVISYRDVLRKYLNWSPKRDVSRRFNKMASSRSAEADVPRLSQLPVEDFGSVDQLLTTSPTTLVSVAILALVKNNVTCLPIVVGDSVEGVFSLRHVLQKVGELSAKQDFEIQFIGLHKTDVEDPAGLQKIAEQEATKIQRHLRQPFHLTIHVKEYEKDGHRHKYSITLRLEYSGKLIATSDDDWEVEAALHKVFTNVRNALQKKLKK